MEARHMLLSLDLSGVAAAAVVARGVFHPAPTSHPVTFVQCVALVSAILGGVMHGVAMAVRKRYGEGHERYYLEWKWWVGTWMDGFAGLLIWPAMPLISVQLLMPMVVVAQLAASYLLGLFFFGESGTKQSHLGILCAMVGVLGLGLSTPTGAEPFHIGDFWMSMVRPWFLLANVVCIAVLVSGYAFTLRSTFWALMAGFLEGVQFVCSRSLADAILESWAAVFGNFAVLAAIMIKGVCILSILHFQQMGLESDMSRFAGIYLVASTLFICTYGAAFFGDPVPLTLAFFLSSFTTLVGIWCLNEAEVRPESEDAAKVPLLNGAAQPDLEGHSGCAPPAG